MGTWNSRGLRGSVLEDMVNYTIERLMSSNLAVLQKIPTPITPIEIDKATRHITLAYFDQKSTVDYIGVVQGIPVCFDAKESKIDTVPLANVHEHQMAFMDDFEKQDGIAFFILLLTHRDELFYIPYRTMKRYWDRAEAGGRKSFRMDELDMNWVLPKKPGILVPYLEMINRDLSERFTDQDGEFDTH